MPIVRNKIFSTNTAEYTLADLRQEMNECISILLNLGYEVHIPTHFAINNRIVKSLGRCCRKRGVYHLEANASFLKTASPQHVHDMIMHECIHCIEGCFNHGPKWKSVASKVVAKYPQYSITRTGQDERYDEVLQTKYKYEILCSHCGKTNGKYLRNSKTLDSIRAEQGRYLCGYCRSKELVVVEL